VRQAVIAAAAVMSALVSGCAQAPKPLYYWGNYPAAAYDTLRGDDKGPQEQLRILGEQAEKAKAAGLPLPPGYHAHLGLIYLKLGRDGDARRALVTEKELFPESAAYIDSLIKRMDAPKS
jgi:hypothetical protein